MTSTQHTPVLIAGGGLVGLCAALFLEYHGVPAILVEKRTDASVLPRSRGVHTRTVELFRQLGIETRVQQAAARVLQAGHFGGASRGATLTTAEPLDLTALMRTMAQREPSPSSFCFLPQDELQPLLAELARERGCDLRFGVELVDFVADGDGVTATLRDKHDASTVVRADYLIAADGGGSPIRRRLGISGSTLPPTQHYINAFVRTDLTGVLRGRTFSQCAIDNDAVRCLVLSKNNTDEWSFHLEYDPTTAGLADYTPRRCVELVRAAIGMPDIDVEVLGRTAWDTGVFVADEYRRGRVFLTGDAAHRHAPWGGYGANTGIADAHNLIWKLAAVLSGTAGPDLLDSYQDERRPRALVAAEQARLGTDFDTRYAVPTADNAADLARQLTNDTVMTRYRYASAALFGGDAGEAHVERLTGQVGTRVPHEWIDRAQRISTLDLSGPGFALLATGTSAAWRDAVWDAQWVTGIDITVHAIPTAAWAERTGLPEGGALLVRPDGIVAGRSDAGLRPTLLAAVLRRLAGTSVDTENAYGTAGFDGAPAEVDASANT
ncbi:monooxygenase [Nocardia brasiliensis]|uniref:Monooxygenase n=1 Tax=Nocardia brasiliensis TaxID=37326 RepID=A0A6G9Y1Q2_NOCBR|nr:FAD-dependent monooxygenase [Nocardia brasiliensis]QIS07007.1 monooxygenase [Nocardia brasiliensis]